MPEGEWGLAWRRYRAFLDLGFGMAEVNRALAEAHRLGLPVRWHVGDVEVPAPDAWPQPHIDNPDSPVSDPPS